MEIGDVVDSLELLEIRAAIRRRPNFRPNGHGMFVSGDILLLEADHAGLNNDRIRPVISKNLNKLIDKSGMSALRVFVSVIVFDPSRGVAVVSFLKPFLF